MKAQFRHQSIIGQVVFLFLICLTATSRQPKQFGWQNELTLEREDPHKKDFWTRKCRMRVYRESHDMEVAKQRR